MNTDAEYEAFMNAPARHITDGDIFFVKLPTLEYDFGAKKPKDGVSVVFEGRVDRLWRIDTGIWTHLGNGVLSGFDATPAAGPKVSMLWNPTRPVVHNPVGGAVFGGASFISMLDNRILTIEGRMLLNGHRSSASSNIFGAFRDGIYKMFPGSFSILDTDPRHIGTHRDHTVSSLHVHIVKRDVAEWTEEDMEKMAELAAETQAVVVAGTGAATSVQAGLDKDEIALKVAKGKASSRFGAFAKVT